MILVYAGNRPDGPNIEARAARFPAQVEPEVTRAVRHVLRSLAPVEIVGGASSGADVVILEAAAALSIPRQVILPFDVGRYFDEAIAPSGEHWVRRARKVLALNETTVTELEETGTGREPYIASNYQLLSRSTQLAARRSLPLAALVVRHLNGQGSSVTDHMVELSLERGLRVLTIDPMTYASGH